MCVCVHVCAHAVRGHRVPWNWSYKWFWATWHECWTELGSSGRASALHCCAISPDPQIYMCVHSYGFTENPLKPGLPNLWVSLKRICFGPFSLPPPTPGLLGQCPAQSTHQSWNKQLRGLSKHGRDEWGSCPCRKGNADKTEPTDSLDGRKRGKGLLVPGAREEKTQDWENCYYYVVMYMCEDTCAAVRSVKPQCLWTLLSPSTLSGIQGSNPGLQAYLTSALYPLNHLPDPPRKYIIWVPTEKTKQYSHKSISSSSFFFK